MTHSPTHPATSLGIDFGGTSVKFGVVQGHNVIDSAPAIATDDFTEPSPLIDAIVRVVEDLRQHHPGICAIGAGVPGFVNFRTGTIHNLTNVAGWTNIPLREILHLRTGLPVTVENDANCMAYAEWKEGAGRGMNHLVCITLGTGVGGGIISHGQMLRGANSVAGELGQMSIDYQGRQGAYGNLGSLEDYIGNNEIAADAREFYASKGVERSVTDCTPAALSQAANNGDEIAVEIWKNIAAKLATSVMNACWLLNPEAIIIGGGVAKAGPLLFDPLLQSLHTQLSPAFHEHLKILPAQFCNDAGIIGAAALALEESEKSHY
ncbi:glucokinase [Oceaniferula spumae]|uniref:Glucokinase n=1 Tax=Oceaniferula spumae TaxID=2979115 RepID=A0AAT9FJX3_9BACT